MFSCKSNQITILWLKEGQKNNNPSEQPRSKNEKNIYFN